MKHCPECQALMEIKKHKVFFTWVCPEGHGTFYPAGELENIIREISGLDNSMLIWSDKEHFSAIESSLISPDGPRLMVELRDTRHMNIMIYGDPETKALWLHSGEEEKLLELIENTYNNDSLTTYLGIAAEEALNIFDDHEPVSKQAAHLLVALKLLGERILVAFPNITL